jgi:hypothetical protein
MEDLRVAINIKMATRRTDTKSAAGRAGRLRCRDGGSNLAGMRRWTRGKATGRAMQVKGTEGLGRRPRRKERRTPAMSRGRRCRKARTRWGKPRLERRWLESASSVDGRGIINLNANLSPSVSSAAAKDTPRRAARAAGSRCDCNRWDMPSQGAGSITLMLSL